MFYLTYLGFKCYLQWCSYQLAYLNAFLAPFLAYVGQPDNPIGRATLMPFVLVWSASTHLTEYSLASFFILTLVLARTRVASAKRVTGGASFKLSK